MQRVDRNKEALIDRNGQNPSADADLGTLMQVQQVYGRGSIVRLTELYYEQSFMDGELDLEPSNVWVRDLTKILRC